jgi:hypothetical protein
VGKEGSEARPKKDNKQTEERKEKTSTQDGKKKQKKTAGIYTKRETNETVQNLHKPQTQDTREREREREREKERQKREMVGGMQGRAATRKEEGKDVGTRDETASGTGALKRDKMQRGQERGDGKKKSVAHSLPPAPKLPSRYLFSLGPLFFIFGQGFFSLLRPSQKCFFSSPE